MSATDLVSDNLVVILPVAACALPMVALSVPACAIAFAPNAGTLLFAKSPTPQRRRHCLPKADQPKLPDKQSLVKTAPSESTQTEALWPHNFSS